MPRLKQSPGVRRFTTPNVDEFQRMMFYELANTRQWNPKTTTYDAIGPNRWRFRCTPASNTEPLWTIEFDGRAVIVTCNEPKVWIRKGLTIDMGNGRVIIEAQS